MAGARPEGLGFALREPLPWEAFAATVREGEALGYRAVFLPEIAGRDAVAALAALAAETRALQLGTGVLPMRSRTPTLIAMGAATVQERSGGRFVLGLGPGDVRSGALEQLRRTVLEVRALLAGETLGPGRRLSLLVGRPIPIWVSALGPRACRLAGEVADGALLNWCTPERVAEARRSVTEAAERVGRNPSEVSLAVYVRCWVGEDEPVGLAALRRAAAEYASYPAYRRQFERMGLEAEAERAAAALRAGRPEEAPEALVRAVAAVGEGAAERLRAYREAGADLVVVYPVAAGEPAASILETLRSLGPGSPAV